ncbi:hypothetical protein QTP88_019922 [Uroleucon formosanum]
MKTNILSDSELLDILENDTFSSDEDFGIDSNDDDDELDTGNLSDENEIDNEDNNSCSIDNNWLSCTPGIKYIPEDQPIDYFNFLFADELLDLLVEETNAYAVDILLSTTSNNARISTWFDTNKSEMKLFFSLLFHMGTIKLARIEDYWKINMLFNIPFFREHMSRNRFMLLLRALHFSRNPKEGELAPRNRLYKIQPILDYFNSKMKEIYEPSKNLSIDESMVLWRGRLIFRQYIQNKRHKYGVKMYMLTEPWGLIHRVMVYSGQGHDVSEDLSHTEFVDIEIEELYFNTIASCETLVEKMKLLNETNVDEDELNQRSSRQSTDISCKSGSCTSNQASIVKLAALSIPEYSGNYKEWATFHHLFVALIHSNEALTVQRFFYLKAALTGECYVSGLTLLTTNLLKQICLFQCIDGVVLIDALTSMDQCNEIFYPNIKKILHIIPCLPVSVASVERSFSTLRKLKTWLRSNMDEERLVGLASLNFLRHRTVEDSKNAWIFFNSIFSGRKVNLVGTLGCQNENEGATNLSEVDDINEKPIQMLSSAKNVSNICTPNNRMERKEKNFYEFDVFGDDLVTRKLRVLRTRYAQCTVQNLITNLFLYEGEIGKYDEPQ